MAVRMPRKTGLDKPCRRCRLTMTRSHTSSGKGRRHVSRGLCQTCYPIERKAGRLEQYPRMQRGRDDVLDQYHQMREEQPRASIANIALQMRIPRTTLMQALRREADAQNIRADGDLAEAG